MRRKTLVLALALVPALAVSASAQTNPQGWSMHEWMWWWGPWHMLMPLLFLGLIVAGVIFLVRKLWPDEPRQFGGSRALDLLDERYAKGELNQIVK